MSQRESFIFYRSFFDASKPLNDAQKAALFEGIMEYALNQKLTKKEPVVQAMFSLIKPQLDANHKRYENGAKGGRPKTEAKPKRNQTVTKAKPNKNVNDNVNDNVNKNEIEALKIKYLTLNIDDEYERFTDYCKANGKKYKDYNAGFRNWCKNALKYQQENNNGYKQNTRYGSKPSQSEQISEGLARLAAEYEQHPSS